MDVTDEQWVVLEPLIPEEERHPSGRGRPWRPARAVFNGILWLLQTGARWQDLPTRYPPYQTVHRRFSQWVDSGVFELMLQTLAEDVYDRGGLDLSECLIDGPFVVAKKGGQKWDRPSGARVPRAWPVQTARVVLSPSTLPLLHPLRSPLLNTLSPRTLSIHHLNM